MNSGKELYKRYNRANCAANELLSAISDGTAIENCSDFNELLKENSQRQQIINEIISEKKYDDYLDFIKGENKSKDVNNLITKIDRLKNRNRRLISSWISIAAGLSAVIVVLGYQLLTPKTVITIASNTNSEFKVPTLIIDMGDKGELNQNVSRNSSKEAAPIDEIRYEASVATKKNVIEYNRLVVPAGYTYRVILSDSTEVLLNAGSILRYPVQFGDSIRGVDLIGEAYFKVKKAKIPFIVSAIDGEIRVYGTEFNVNNKSGSSVEVVLVNGSVGFKSGVNAEQMITPGQKLTYDIGFNYAVENVDVYQYTAWTQNKFMFIEQPLSSVLADIAIWYDVSFKSKISLDDYTFTMATSRNTDIETILKMISDVLDINIIKERKGEYMIE